MREREKEGKKDQKNNSHTGCKEEDEIEDVKDDKEQENEWNNLFYTKETPNITQRYTILVQSYK